MKLTEVLTEEQLNEVNVRKTLSAATLAALMAGGTYATFKPTIDNFLNRHKSTQKAPTPTPTPTPTPEPKQDEVKILTDRILSKYKRIDPKLASQIATLAKKYEKPIFPKAEDLLTIVGIESAFNPKAVSQLKKDPAIGLTQIRPGVHKMDARKLGGDIEQQIQKSSEILDQYNKGLKDPEAAIIAYNAGYGAYEKGKYNQNYINKFNKEKQLYK
jgi:Transglycosylase SLT domain